MEQSQEVKGVNFSTLRNNLLNVKAVSSLKLCCLNCRSVNHRTLAVFDFIISNNIDACALTETWLSNQTSPAIPTELTPDGFKFLNQPRIGKKGSELGITYKKNLDIKILESRELTLGNFECLNCTVSCKNKTFFLRIVYRSLPSKANG